MATRCDPPFVVVRAIRTLMAVVVQARQRRSQGFSEPVPDARGIFIPESGLYARAYAVLSGTPLSCPTSEGPMGTPARVQYPGKAPPPFVEPHRLEPEASSRSRGLAPIDAATMVALHAIGRRPPPRDRVRFTLALAAALI